jgi:hypothetical protein
MGWRGLIVVLWRAGLRIQEALALNEAGLGHRRGSLLVRRGTRRPREAAWPSWQWPSTWRGYASNEFDVFSGTP